MKPKVWWRREVRSAEFMSAALIFAYCLPEDEWEGFEEYEEVLGVEVGTQNIWKSTSVVSQQGTGLP